MFCELWFFIIFMRHKTRITNVQFYKCHQLAIGHRTWNMRHGHYVTAHKARLQFALLFLFFKKWIEAKKSVFYDWNIFENKTKQQPNAVQNKPIHIIQKPKVLKMNRVVHVLFLQTNSGQPSEKKITLTEMLYVRNKHT